MQHISLLWFTENYPPDKGGMAQSCDRLVYNLRQNNIEVHIINFSNKRQAKKLTLLQNGSEMVINLEGSVEHSLVMAHLLIQKEKIYKNCTHIVAFGGNLPMFFAPMISKSLQKSLIICFRGNDFDMGIFSPKRREQLFYALQSASAIACVSTDKQKFINSLFPNLSTYHTPNGLDSKNWLVLPSDKLKAQKIKQSIDDEKIVIGIFGQLKIKKGLSFFLNALEKGILNSKVHLIIIGDITEITIFEKIEKIGITYTHLPFLDRYELIAYYLACDIIGIPSFYDGMPNVLLEAALLKKPFIASNVAGMYDFLEDEKDAFLFQVNDVDSAILALQKMRDASRALLCQMGEYAYHKAINNYTEIKEIKAYISIFKNH